MIKHSIKKIFRTQLKNLRFALSANNSPLFIGFYKYLYKPSKNSLSAFLDAYSKANSGELTVIQIGANDGITHDPIHKYIKRDKWKGVLLEPQSFVFHKYLTRIYAKNEGLHTLCAAIGEEDGTQTLYKIGFSEMRWATGLASFNRDNLEKAFDIGLVKSRCKKHGITIPESPDEQISSEEVTMISPPTLLKRYNISSIDLLQVDTEGFDYEVIRIFDIAKTKPKVIIFENVHLSAANYTLCKELLAGNNYRFREYDSNTLAMREDVTGYNNYL